MPFLSLEETFKLAVNRTGVRCYLDDSYPTNVEVRENTLTHTIAHTVKLQELMGLRLLIK